MKTLTDIMQENEKYFLESMELERNSGDKEVKKGTYDYLNLVNYYINDLLKDNFSFIYKYFLDFFDDKSIIEDCNCRLFNDCNIRDRLEFYAFGILADEEIIEHNSDNKIYILELFRKIESLLSEIFSGEGIVITKITTSEITEEMAEEIGLGRAIYLVARYLYDLQILLELLIKVTSAFTDDMPEYTAKFLVENLKSILSLLISEVELYKN